MVGTKMPKNDLGSTLFPESRRAILALLFSHPDEAFYLRQIVDLTGLAVGQTQRELQRLTAAGIIKRSEQGRHVYFSANEACPIYDELRGIAVKTTGVVAVLGAALAQLDDRTAVAFVFGSVARGEEKRASDVDLMVIGDASFAEVSSAIASAERALRREINLVVYPVREFQSKVQQGHSFVRQVIDGEKIFVEGSVRELDALLAEPVDP
jgi:predicted nucleotidyltransferase